MYIRIAWRNIWRNRRRTLITVSSVFFAVVLTIIMRSATSGVYEKMIEDVVSFSSGYIQIHRQGYWNEQVLDNSFAADQDLENLIKGNPEFPQYVPRLESYALASSGEITKGVLVIGIVPEEENKLTRLETFVTEGNYLHDSDKAVMISEGVAATLGINCGDTIILIGQGYHGASAAAKYHIKAIVRLASPELNKRMIYIPLNEAQEMYGAPLMLTSISIQLKDADKLEPLAAGLRQKTDSTLYEVMTWKEMLPELDQLIEADRSGHMITVNLLYLVVSFGLFGTILMMTNERIREMGILIAIGMKKRILSLIVLLEILLLSLVATISGIAVSLPLLLYFSKYPIHFTGQLAEVYKSYGMDPVISLSTSPSIFLSQAAVVFSLSVVLASYPLYKIATLNPVEAIHS